MSGSVKIRKVLRTFVGQFALEWKIGIENLIEKF